MLRPSTDTYKTSKSYKVCSHHLIGKRFSTPNFSEFRLTQKTPFRHIHPPRNRPHNPRRITHQVQDARQPRIPTMEQTLLGPVLPRHRLRRHRTPQSLWRTRISTSRRRANAQLHKHIRRPPPTPSDAQHSRRARATTGAVDCQRRRGQQRAARGKQRAEGDGDGAGARARLLL